MPPNKDEIREAIERLARSPYDRPNAVIELLDDPYVVEREGGETYITVPVAVGRAIRVVYLLCHPDKQWRLITRLSVLAVMENLRDSLESALSEIDRRRSSSSSRRPRERRPRVPRAARRGGRADR